VAAFALTRGIVLAALHVGAANMTAARRAEWAWIPEKPDLFRGPHFLSLPYPESMFAAFLAAALLSLRKEEIGQAAVYGALASMTRSAGVVVAACLLYVAWQH